MKTKISLSLMLLWASTLSAHICRADAISTDLRPVDLAALTRSAASAPEIVAPSVRHSANLEGKGSWTESAGWSTWTYSVTVPGARSLGFHTSVLLPAGATLSMAGQDGVMVKTYDESAAASTLNVLTSVLVPGDVLRLSLRVPADRRTATWLDIDRLYVGLKPSPLEQSRLTFAPHASTSAGQVNWSCVRSSANELAGDATVMYTVEASNPGGSGPGLAQCTGTLMNDVPQDGKLYLLTAAHCGQTNYDPGTITVYWNRVSSCPAGLESAMSAPGPTTSGGTTRALYATGGINHEDQWLIELNGTGVPAGSEAVFSGWDASNVTNLSGGGPSNIFGINHAAAETKQYTASNNGPSGSTPPFLDYTLSTGESRDGASGSGAFESNQRLFGTLSGGGSDLNGNPTVSYMPLALSWHGDGGTDSPASSTGLWLDPARTGALQLDPMVAPSAPGVTVSVNPTSVVVGTGYTVTWSSADATSCTASGAWSGSRALNGSLTVTPATSGDFNYVLTCSNGGGNTSQSAMEVVNSPAGGSSSSGGASGSSGGGGGALDWLTLLGLNVGLAWRKRKGVTERPRLAWRCLGLRSIRSVGG